MDSAKEDEDSAFRSVMSMDKLAFSRNDRNKENLSQNSVTVTSISSSRSRPIDAERINAGFVVNFKRNTLSSTPAKATGSGGYLNVSQPDLIRDTLFAMENIPGTFICYDDNVNSLYRYRLKEK
ncbi:Oidioi.mRNA.OKI2018_I69.PAR.g10063.t1.cds [Oikopleura dioica]|uniref:Oidioi.mRNA.OKI2018_I69.PAR.g10063.t1.cds n=1 Tax=Oikopleura dioica TaxID=34765 RepID=A0ABN7RS99_OIKDI|nr:Oidioi.mRNA.OKI2018_I69.PAR.g10063.t1.cds [Oikopleura dioica]